MNDVRAKLLSLGLEPELVFLLVHGLGVRMVVGGRCTRARASRTGVPVPVVGRHHYLPR